MGIMNKPPSKEYQDNYDKIFGKKGPTEQDIRELQEAHDALNGMTGVSNKPRMLSEIERSDLREDLKETISTLKTINTANTRITPK